MNRIRVLALLSLSLLACSSDTPAVTQIVITVDSNLKVPEEIDRITIDVRGLVQTQHAAADLKDHDLPRHLTLVHDDGPLGPIRVTTTGWIGEQIKVVEYTTDVSFEMHETVALNIDLDRACRNYFCDEDPDKTCKAGRCEPIEEPQKPIDAGGTPDVDSGPSPKPDAGTTKDAGPTPPVDAGKPDAGPKNQAPTCTITSPGDGDTFTTTEMVALEGSCSDPESGDLPDKALRWSSDDGALGLGPQITLPPQPAGSQTFKLCASDPKDSTLTGCAEASITIMVPTPPTAMITDVRQGSNKESPFRADEPLRLTGEGTGEQITYTWTDTFIGEFGNDDVVNLEVFERGRHRVTLTVTDDVGQTAEDSVTFQANYDPGSSLAEGLPSLNPTFANGASVLAADSGTQMLAASGTSYRFEPEATTPMVSSAFTDPSLITLSTITAITIWEPTSLVYLGTTTGLVVCPYTAGATIDATMCTLYQGGDFPSDHITSVARATVDSTDWLLVGTTNGLFIPDDLKGASTGANTLFKDEAVNAIVESNGLFWFTSADSGLLYYDPARDRIRSAANGLDGPSLQLGAIAADESGAIWVGSASKGVGRYDPDAKSWQVWATGDAPEPGLSNNQVSALATTHVTLGGKPHDVVWIGTNGGVSRLDADVPSFMTLDDADGLPSNAVQAIAVTSTSGMKVLSTDLGLAYYSAN